MKAIGTKYLPATNNKGSRIKATDFDGNTLTISYPGEYDTEKAHRVVAEGLRDKMGWAGDLAAGATDKGYVFVFVDTQRVIEALKVLAEYCTSGRRYYSTNPYGIPEIRAALEVIAASQGKTDYLQADLTPAQ